jgi:hypothetical protein
MHLQPAVHEPELLTSPRSFRLGRRVLYRRDDLHDWIDTERDRAVPTDA